MKKTITLIMAIVMLMMLSVVAVSAKVSIPFTDVAEDAWYYLPVSRVYYAGIMQGTSETTFAPDHSLTRAMLVTLLWRANGEEVTNHAMSFNDVEADTWYTEAVRWAAGKGLVYGYSDTEFGTNDNVSREQMATILYRFCIDIGYSVESGENTNILSFDDMTEFSEYAIPALQWACAENVLLSEGAKLRPKDAALRCEAAQAMDVVCGKQGITREELAVILVTMFVGQVEESDIDLSMYKDADELIEGAENHMISALTLGLLKDDGDGYLYPKRTMTNEEYAVAMYNMAKHMGADMTNAENTNILSYDDALEVSEEAMAAMQWAIAEGVVVPKGTRILPKENASALQLTYLVTSFLVQKMEGMM